MERLPFGLVARKATVHYSMARVHLLSGQTMHHSTSPQNPMRPIPTVAGAAASTPGSAAAGKAPGGPRPSSLPPLDDTPAPAPSASKTATTLPPLKSPAANPVATAGWTELLKSIDPTHTAATGKWTAEGAGLSSGGDAASNTLTLGSATDGSYEFQATLIRATDTPDPANLILPAGTGTFAVGISNKSITLGNVGGQSIPSAPGAVPAIPAGKECTVDVKVMLQKRNVEIAVMLDGKQVNGWLGPQSSLTSPMGALTDPQAFALNTGKTKFTFTAVRVHPTTGQLRPSRTSPPH
jgi:hypothetical protein